jgi:predicted RNA methylase
LLLDGGLGSFAISTGSDDVWRNGQAREWAFSSDVPHHVAVNRDKVIVTRWDEAKPEAFSTESVENKLPKFFKYLVADRVQASRSVTDRLVDLFRRTRSLVSEVGADDAETVNLYLAVLTMRLSESGRQLTEWPTEIGGDAISRLLEFSRFSIRDLDLRTNLELAVRHAGSEIFQEAHFALVQSSPGDLFGWNAPAVTERQSRGTSHFTPPALARIVIEKTIDSAGELEARDELVVMDPACGSASFLYEAVRTLRRKGFTGKLRLVGRDISSSAVAMAEFMMKFARADWEPAGGIELDIKVANSLEEELPIADIVVMNPPFLSWSAMSNAQREVVNEALGRTSGGRPDLSMAFISQGLRSVKEGGALGAVMPASLLSLETAQKWRSDLLDRAHLSVLSSLGEYGLFRHATVQVATAVLTKSRKSSDETLTLIADNESNATGDALRALRRSDLGAQDGWSLFYTSPSELGSGSNWKPLPPNVRSVLARFAGMGRITELGRLFSIKQGIRTGANNTFLLSQEELERLPSSEKRFFRPALTSDNLSEGRLSERQWVFYPYSEISFSSADEVQKVLPSYYEKYLLPSKTALAKRASILSSPSKNWWDLARHRSWINETEGQPRIVSKYFGAPGSFALDQTGRFAVVQGFAWFPIWNAGDSDLDDQSLLPSEAVNDEMELLILRAFTSLFNSGPFHTLARYFSNHVGGGQIDLSPRYSDFIPVPAMNSLIIDSHFGRIIRRLAEASHMWEEFGPSDPLWQREVASLVAELYGQEILELQ